MAFDFPNSPTVGQTYNGYTWDGEKWTLTTTAQAGSVRYDLPQGLSANQQAQARSNVGVAKKNYIINGGMQISQENGVTGGTTSGFYPVDMFAVASGGAGAFSTSLTGVPTSSTGLALHYQVATADAAAPATGDIAIIYQTIEGFRAADLRFGTSAAKTATLQFGCKAPAGTYCISVRNGASNRSYVADYVISAGEANTVVIKTVTIPGDTTGTWNNDNTAGLTITWALVAGATYQTASGSWAGGNFLASSNISNFGAVINNDFFLFDVSLTEGSVAPPFMVPDYASELAACKRYFWKVNFAASQMLTTLQAYNASSANGPLFVFSPEMRATPTANQTAGSSFILQAAAGGGGGVTSFAYNPTPQGVSIGVSGTTSFRAGDAVAMYANGSASFMIFSARL